MSAVAALLLLTACATHKKSISPSPHDHARARFHTLGSPDVDYGETDWHAVRAALGEAGDAASGLTHRAGGYGKVIWASTGQKMIDFAAGRIVTEDPGVVSSCGFAWPANGKISRGYKPPDDCDHNGIDITADTGTPVYAARAGKVIYADNELSGFGKCIIIQHDPIWTTFYAHNNNNFVRAGDIVECGQVIAEVGATGRATGPHLHFEIRQNGTALDPHPMLP